jgi:hypothetical protein
MKKISIICILAATCGLANAITVSAPSSLTGVNALSGESAYSWGIPISLAPGQSISAASLVFNNVTLTAANSSGHGILYSDLLKSTLTGVHTYTDNDASGDYFTGAYAAANIASLGSEYFAHVGTTLSWTVTFSSTQLAALNQFLVNGIFDLGFDPDCHYTVGSICLNYTTTPVSTPDTATTVYLLGLGLLTLEVARRKYVLAQAKK